MLGMFEAEPGKAKLTVEKAAPDEFVLRPSITRSREVGLDRSGALVVTEGTGSLYQCRTIFGALHDYGKYSSIAVISDSVSEAKKNLISRKARYSGLLDVLSFHESAVLDSAMADADTWLALNVDEKSFPEQVRAAKAAGISRVFALFTTEGPSQMISDEEAMLTLLSESGMTYTVMRTGKLVEEGTGGGLTLAAVDVPVCEDVPREDVFRFITEALTLPEAADRLFALCPSVASTPALTQMRLCGYTRREEVKAMLGSLLPLEQSDEAADEMDAAQVETVMRSAAEVEAEREAELKVLLEKARQRGIETQARLKYEEEQKLIHRQEMEKYYKGPSDDTSIPDAVPADLVSKDGDGEDADEKPKDTPDK